NDLIVETVEHRVERTRLAVVVGKSRPPIRDDGRQLRACLGQRDARLHSSDDAVAARAPGFQFVFRERNWLPNIDPLAERAALQIEDRQRKLELRRHDADDGQTAAVEGKLFADQLRIAIKTTLPEP